MLSTELTFITCINSFSILSLFPFRNTIVAFANRVPVSSWVLVSGRWGFFHLQCSYSELRLFRHRSLDGLFLVLPEASIPKYIIIGLVYFFSPGLVSLPSAAVGMYWVYPTEYVGVFIGLAFFPPTQLLSASSGIDFGSLGFNHALALRLNREGVAESSLTHRYSPGSW